jgi:hypothetical protein
VPNGGGGGSGKRMGGGGGGYDDGGSGWKVNRVEGAGTATTSEHNTSGKVSYGEPLGIELYKTVVVTSEATNQEKGMSQLGATRTPLR